MHMIVALSKSKPMQFSTFMLWNDVDFHLQKAIKYGSE